MLCADAQFSCNNDDEDMEGRRMHARASAFASAQHNTKRRHAMRTNHAHKFHTERQTNAEIRSRAYAHSHKCMLTARAQPNKYLHTETYTFMAVHICQLQTRRLCIMSAIARLNLGGTGAGSCVGILIPADVRFSFVGWLRC